MNRREFLLSAGAAAATALARPSLAQAPADYHLQIAPVDLEIAPKRIVRTVAYNGQAPGPLLRWPEGKPLTIDVTNKTDLPEIVHWHGLFTPSDMDGAAEEGSPMIDPGATLRYRLTPEPAGFRWYHTHAFAGHHLDRGLYSGQFGCFYIDPRQHAGDYDQEVFLTLHDWNAHMGGGGDASMEAAYDYATINGHMLGYGEPIQVKQGSRVLFRILNASATVTHWIALPGHALNVIALDGNAVPSPQPMAAVRLAPAERVEAVVTMDHPGVWIMGETRPEIRKTGMGIVVEYMGMQGEPVWAEPPLTTWDYRLFANKGAPKQNPDVVVPLVVESKFQGHGAFDRWTINGKSFPHTDPIVVQQGKRYRFKIVNKSTDNHPVHLHRHTFEVVSLDGQSLSGLRKDVVMVDGKTTAEFDFTADHPGPTLFHCHQQTHMDFGFMSLLRYE